MVGESSASADGGQEPRGPVPAQTDASVGMVGSLLYLRAWDDRLRLYPEAAFRVDGTWAARPSGLAASTGAESSGAARLAVRRFELGLSGELSRFVAFTAEVEMGGQRIGQTRFVGPLTPRWMPASANDGVLRAGEVSITFSPFRALRFTVGQVRAPFSMSNRTPEPAATFMEQPIAIRGFAMPYERALGAMIWGETEQRAFAYEVGAFSVGPIGRKSFDVVGRAFARPLAHLGRGVFYELLQVGVSARSGWRETADHTEVPSIATGSGFVMWQPGYIDAFGRITRILASGPQRSFGGELRAPFRTPTHAVFDLRAEAYYLRADSREAFVGSNTASGRIGRLAGAAWYVSLDWWACFIPGFTQLVTGEPGITRPRSLDDPRTTALAHGLEVSVLAGGIHATYEPTVLSNTGSRNPPKDITIYQFGGAIQYLLGASLRGELEYMAYVAPESGNARATQVVVPDNLPRAHGPSGAGHVAHELGFRIGAAL